jgi:hypothetical protein
VLPLYSILRTGTKPGQIGKPANQQIGKSANRQIVGLLTY